jgi:Fic family protein
MLLSEADRALAELSGIGSQLPNPYFLIYPYSRREAVASSAIEGTVSTVYDLFFFEAGLKEEYKSDLADSKPDLQEVRNYVLAMEHGIAQLEKLPISTRLICKIHRELMQGVRGQSRAPGEVRRTQNWVGPPGSTPQNATYVPPPVDDMWRALSNWEKYINRRRPTEPMLIRCALTHYQFEAIHPFLDGNGRIGRLLIPFFLFKEEILSRPLLYISEFFATYKDEYYARLLAVNQKGDWRGWIEFFLEAVKQQAKDGISDARKITAVHNEYRRMVDEDKKVPGTAYRLVEELFLNPIVSIPRLSKRWKMSFMSVKRGVERLVMLGILGEMAERNGGRMYCAPKLLAVLGRKED